MATAVQLAQRGEVTAIDGGLWPHELPERCIYALPRALTWLEDVLPGLETDGFHPGAATPLEQADALFHGFIAGEPLGDMLPKQLQPNHQDHGVWELRTRDLRFFGWFWVHSIFILSGCDTKENCAVHGLYAGYRSQAIRDRDHLDLDPPKFITGEIEDVL